MRTKAVMLCLSSLVAVSVSCGLVTDESKAPPGIKLVVSPTALTVTDTLYLSLSNASHRTRWLQSLSYLPGPESC